MFLFVKNTDQDIHLVESALNISNIPVYEAFSSVVAAIEAGKCQIAGVSSLAFLLGLANLDEECVSHVTDVCLIDIHTGDSIALARVGKRILSLNNHDDLLELARYASKPMKKGFEENAHEIASRVKLPLVEEE